MSRFAGPSPAPTSSTGWWGVVLLLLVLASMLSTLLFAYAYLGSGPPGLLPLATTADPLLAGAATALALASLPGAVALHLAVRSDNAARMQLAALVTLTLGGCFAAAVAADLAAFAPRWRESGTGSAYAVIEAFHLAVAVAGLLGLAALQLRLWGPRAAPRVKEWAGNLVLYWYYVVGGWLIVAATLHLAPGGLR